MSLSKVRLADFTWLDYTNPDTQMLQQIAVDLGLSEKVLLNCLDTDYLPHIETYGTTHFVVLRLMEPHTKLRSSSVQELTTKIALFIHSGAVVSVHRLPLVEIDEVRRRVTDEGANSVTKQKLLTYFFEQVSLGFDKPLSDLEVKLDVFEQTLFKKRKSGQFLQDGFYLKRKASAFKKVLKLTLDLMNKLVLKVECPPEHFQQSRDRLERSLFYAEDVFENIQSLLNLHVSIESQKTNEASFKTNEIVRVLTLLTIFFLPLNFIVGLFGMNFEHIPLLNNPYGFWFSVGLMSLLSVMLGWYLYRQGWLKRPDVAFESESK